MSTQTPPVWTAEAKKMLKELWPRYAASAIAKKLSKTFNLELSRCAVIGKAHRMALVMKRKGKHVPELHEYIPIKTCRYCTFLPIKGGDLCFGCAQVGQRAHAQP